MKKLSILLAILLFLATFAVSNAHVRAAGAGGAGGYWSGSSGTQSPGSFGAGSRGSFGTGPCGVQPYYAPGDGHRQGQ
jgi:hypothetical protein